MMSGKGIKQEDDKEEDQVELELEQTRQLLKKILVEGSLLTWFTGVCLQSPLSSSCPFFLAHQMRSIFNRDFHLIVCVCATERK